MKLVKKSIVAAALLSASVISPSALAEKVGYVNVQAILQSLPQYQQIQPTLAEEFKDQLQQRAKLEGDIKFLQEKAQRDAATMSEDQKKALAQEIQQKGQEYQSLVGPLQQQFQARGQEERNKILQVIREAVNSYAAEQNYDVILSSGSLVYLKDQEQEISQEIIEKITKTQ